MGDEHRSFSREAEPSAVPDRRSRMEDRNGEPGA
jgi:hypothetical protein